MILRQRSKYTVDSPTSLSTTPITKGGGGEDREKDWRNDPEITDGINAWQRLKRTNSGTSPLQDMTQATLKVEDLEQDFTTNGAKGDLKCPFARRAASRQSRYLRNSNERPRSLPTPPDLKGQPVFDPIAAEFHADALGSPPPSVDASGAKCPIRFLDDHSPEEVAKYFENHKHEIPRSHEICVKRFQSNSGSIRKLDAKYGNLVNMIQGLSVKHRPMLASGDEAGKSSVMLAKDSSEEIGRWAESVSPVESTDHLHRTGEERSSRFEKPLHEVRLGESPSRPWGIQVPVEEATAASADLNEATSNAAQSTPVRVPSPGRPLPTKESAAKRPFGHHPRPAPKKAASTVAAKPAFGASSQQDRTVVAEKKSSTPRVVFNGPVFFGYPPSSIPDVLKAMQEGEAT